MKRWRLREKAFKRVAFASTLVGVVLMAIGLQQGLVNGRWLLTLLLFVGGGALALVSVLIELVPEAGFTVTFYTREGCSLCEAPRDFLRGKKEEYDFDLWEVDVDRDPKALARYGDWVPVATVGEEELFRLSPDYPRLERRLRELADARVRR